MAALMIRRDSTQRWLMGGAMLVAGCFALHALLLIDATSFWKDELSTAYKVYELSWGQLLNHLRRDSHPPFYYALLWLLGHIVPNAAWPLRIISWLAYCAGGTFMVLQAGLLARAAGLSRIPRVLASSALMAFATPFPLRFSIEAKGYALLVALLALALLLRMLVVLRREPPDLFLVGAYGLVLAMVALTHYYGLFYLTGLVVVDLFQFSPVAFRGSPVRRQLALAAVLASLPVLGWLWFAVDLGASSSAVSWIGFPDFGLIEDILVRFLGPMPLPKIFFVGLLLFVMRQRGWLACSPDPSPSIGFVRKDWLDLSGLQAGMVMSLLVVLVSFRQPVAFSRYFIVLLPSLVVWSSCELARWKIVGKAAHWIVGATLVVALSLSWVQSFELLDPGGPARGSRESSDFRLISRMAVGYRYKYCQMPRQQNSADLLLADQGLIPSPMVRWRSLIELKADASGPRRGPFVVAATSGSRRLPAQFLPVQEWLRVKGFECRNLVSGRPHVRLLECRMP